MTGDIAEQTLLDPIGTITRLVVAVEPVLTADLIEDIVIGVAGGRAKSRRLAQTLAARPALLRDGRSPAPRAVGDLLIALRRAGSQAVSPPHCAECGKQLRTLSRRGEHWYCAGCAVRPEPCFSCGRTRVISTRDRQGRPRCDQCPDSDKRDPLSILTDVIGRLDPSLPAQAISAATGRVFARANQLRRLAWVVKDQPGLLTGEGAQAPIPGVLRLIDQLCELGAEKITRPACPRCRRVVQLANDSTASGCVAAVSPRLERCPAHVAAASVSPPPGTTTENLCAPTAWSTIPSTWRNALPAAGAAVSPPTARTGRSAAAVGPGSEWTARSAAGRCPAWSPPRPASPGARHVRSAGPAALVAARSAPSAAAPWILRSARNVCPQTRSRGLPA